MTSDILLPIGTQSDLPVARNEFRVAPWKSRFARSKSELSRSGRAEKPRFRGITMIELMVAMTLSLIMIYGMMRFFGELLSSVADGRAAIEMSGQLRGAAHRLQADLRGVTTPVRPWASPEAGLGYFEYVENIGHDADPSGMSSFADPSITYGGAFGDIDDVLAFTARSDGRPFVGEYHPNLAVPPRAIQSHYAEVVWWTVWVDLDGDGLLLPAETKLYRRALLIRPDLNILDRSRPGLVAEFQGSPAELWIALRNFYNHNDISVRAEVQSSGGGATIRLWANSLADLTKRENRIAHRPILQGTSDADAVLIPDANAERRYPFEFRTSQAADRVFLPSLFTLVQTAEKEGEDVMLANVTGFDVKAFDPYAPVLVNPNIASESLIPGDPGFGAIVASGTDWRTFEVSRGAFVDLNYARYHPGFTSANSYFWDIPIRHPTTGNPWGVLKPSYDTWSFHYEQDGIDQDGVLGVDQGTNGFDDNGMNGVDDIGERETSPPYPVPLRGIKVTIRMVEPDSRQVKQVSVINDFTPE